VVIGFETDWPDMPYWGLVENLFLLLFTAEIVLRVLVVGPAPYFDHRGPDFLWNAFDFLVVMLGLSDIVVSWVTEDVPGDFPMLFRTLRLLRVVRIFRIVRFLKEIYVLTVGFAAAAVAIRNVAVLMMGSIYLCSIIIVRITDHWATDSLHYDLLQSRFGSVFPAMLSLFDLMVVPDLTEYREVLTSHPLMAAFLISFVVFASFGLIGLLTGLVCESVFEKNQLRLDEERAEGEAKRQFLKERCEELFDRIAHNARGEATVDDVKSILPLISDLFIQEGVSFAYHDLQGTAYVMDTDNSGTIDKEEFCRGVLQIADGLRPMSIMELHYAVSVAKVKMDRCEVLLHQLLRKEGKEDGSLSRATSCGDTALRPPAPPADAAPGDLRAQLRQDLAAMQACIMAELQGLAHRMEDVATSRARNLAEVRTGNLTEEQARNADITKVQTGGHSWAASSPRAASQLRQALPSRAVPGAAEWRAFRQPHGLTACSASASAPSSPRPESCLWHGSREASASTRGRRAPRPHSADPATGGRAGRCSGGGGGILGRKSVDQILHAPGAGPR